MPNRSALNLSLAMLASILALAPCAHAEDAADPSAENWPQWRGPLGTGEGPRANPPVKWGANENIKWKTAIPGHGSSSSPIVWGDHVFILSAEKTGEAPEKTGEGPEKPAASAEKAPAPPAAESADPGGRRGPGGFGRGERGGRGGRGGSNRAAPSETYRFLVQCVSRATGELLWQSAAIEAVPHEGHHQHHGYASSSPVTDGRRVIASFGSRGVFAYDFEGKKLWERDLGDMKTRNAFGEGSSPALHDGLVFVQWDHEGEDKFFALEADTGKIRWQADRDGPTAWATPQVVRHGGVTQVVVNATNKSRSYEAQTGKLLWSCGGQTTNVIPSPVIAGGVAYCMSGFKGAALRAIGLDARGDLADGDPAILWKHGESTPYVPSPLLYDSQLYFLAGNKNILSVLNARDGAVLRKPGRLEGLGDIYASPVGAAGRVYITDREGTTLVIERGPEAKVLATNPMEEPIDASPALAGNQIFLRGASNLYCIEAR